MLKTAFINPVEAIKEHEEKLEKAEKDRKKVQDEIEKIIKSNSDKEI